MIYHQTFFSNIYEIVLGIYLKQGVQYTRSKININMVAINRMLVPLLFVST